MNTLDRYEELQPLHRQFYFTSLFNLRVSQYYLGWIIERGSTEDAEGLDAVEHFLAFLHDATAWLVEHCQRAVQRQRGGVAPSGPRWT